MSIKPERMDEDKLNAFLDSELRQTIGLGDGGEEISEERLRNLEMYLNRPDGTEEDGHSQLQASTVHDVIEALLPSTLAPFISADKVVEFKPVEKADEDDAEISTLYLNHIFMVDNDGVDIQYTWQKDAFLQKNGFVYADWCERERVANKFGRMDYFGLVTLIQDKEVEVLEYAAFNELGQALPPMQAEALLTASAMIPPGIVFEVKYRRTWTEGRIKVENIPPEYVVVSNTARDTESARLIGWIEEVTLSNLREEGYSEDQLEKIKFGDDSYTDNAGERTAREQAQGGFLDSQDSTSTDPASRKTWRTVVWTRVDYDGDGKAELRKIVRAGARGTGGVILLNEEADEVPVISFTSVPMPHQLFGRAVADQAAPIQEAQTAFIRQMADATYHTVNPRWKYVEEFASEDTWDDLMMDIPGAPVRMTDERAIQQLRDAPDIGAAYQALEYFDRLRETRTPVTRQDQGVDVNALQDKTAAEAQIQANATAMRKELILRLYAESLGKLFRLMNRLVIKYQDKPRLVRLYPDKDPVQVDPRTWNADMDVSVRVGLGTGTKDQQMQGIMTIHNIQMQDLQMGLPTVNPELLYNTRAQIVEYQGLSNPERYFNNPNRDVPEMGVDPAAEEAKQAEAQQVEQAINQAGQQGFEQGREAGKQEGVDAVKMAGIESKERMHNKELAVKTMFGQGI